MPTEFKKQTAETRGKMQAEVKIKYEELKTRGSKRDQMIDMGVFIRRYTCTRNFISKIPKTQVKRHFLALVKHYFINLGFLISPFCRTKLLQEPELVIILCISPLLTCRPFWIFFVFTITSGPAKLVGIEPSLWQTVLTWHFAGTKSTLFILFLSLIFLLSLSLLIFCCTPSLNFTPGLHSAFYPQSAVRILPPVCICGLHFTPFCSLHFTGYPQSVFYPKTAVCRLLLHWPDVNHYCIWWCSN